MMSRREAMLIFIGGGGAGITAQKVADDLAVTIALDRPTGRPAAMMISSGPPCMFTGRVHPSIALKRPPVGSIYAQCEPITQSIALWIMEPDGWRKWSHATYQSVENIGAFKVLARLPA